MYAYVHMPVHMHLRTRHLCHPLAVLKWFSLDSPLRASSCIWQRHGNCHMSLSVLPLLHGEWLSTFPSSSHLGCHMPVCLIPLQPYINVYRTLTFHRCRQLIKEVSAVGFAWWDKFKSMGIDKAGKQSEKRLHEAGGCRTMPWISTLCTVMYSYCKIK